MDQIFYYTWFYILYSIFGWFLEVTFHGIKFKEFVNRGFLNGPFCPIYGFGIIGAIFILKPVQNNIILLFLAGVLLTSTLELLTGFILERVFNKKWWNYSAMPHNYNGYICLRYSIYWGVGIVLVIKIIHPYMTMLISLINNPFGIILGSLLLTLILIDFIVTLMGIMEIKRDIHTLDEIARKLNDYSEEFGESIFKGISQTIAARENAKEKWDEIKIDFQEKFGLPRKRITDLIEKYEKVLSKKSFIQERLEKAFPNIKDSIKKKK